MQGGGVGSGKILFIRRLKKFLAKPFTPHQRQKLVVGKIKVGGAKIIFGSTNLDAKNFGHEIDRYALTHTLKKHSHDLFPVNAKDFENIFEIIKTPDEIFCGTKTKQGLLTLVYKKQYRTFTIIYVEEIRTGRTALVLKTMYKTKTPRLFRVSCAKRRRA